MTKPPWIGTATIFACGLSLLVASPEASIQLIGGGLLILAGYFCVTPPKKKETSRQIDP